MNPGNFARQASGLTTEPPRSLSAKSIRYAAYFVLFFVFFPYNLGLPIYRKIVKKNTKRTTTLKKIIFKNLENKFLFFFLDSHKRNGMPKFLTSMLNGVLKPKGTK